MNKSDTDENDDEDADVAPSFKQLQKPTAMNDDGDDDDDDDDDSFQFGKEDYDAEEYAEIVRT